MTEFLGRAKYARLYHADSRSGYRNGHARPRKLTLSSGTIELSRPRVRNTEGKFESRLLPPFANRTAKVAELIPHLYLHGLSEGDFDLALGEDAPLAAAARLRDGWNEEPAFGERLLRLGLKVVELNGQEVEPAISYGRDNRSPSLPDSFAPPPAEIRKWALLTGDQALRILAQRPKVTCHGAGGFRTEFTRRE